MFPQRQNLHWCKCIICYVYLKQKRVNARNSLATRVTKTPTALTPTRVMHAGARKNILAMDLCAVVGILLHKWCTVRSLWSTHMLFYTTPCRTILSTSKWHQPRYSQTFSRKIWSRPTNYLCLWDRVRTCGYCDENMPCHNYVVRCRAILHER